MSEPSSMSTMFFVLNLSLSIVAGFAMLLVKTVFERTSTAYVMQAFSALLSLGVYFMAPELWLPELIFGVVMQLVAFAPELIQFYVDRKRSCA